jgi:hypothetical protein
LLLVAAVLVERVRRKALQQTALQEVLRRLFPPHQVVATTVREVCIAERKPQVLVMAVQR